MLLSISEENYLKSIFSITIIEKQSASTNAIAKDLDTKASSVTDMLKKLAEKKLIKYQKYKPVVLSKKGKAMATQLIRSHRLWETFLVKNLGFNWSEVHDIAEQLEHIDNDELTDRLSDYLNNPSFDPHGDPIPDKNGTFPYINQIRLSKLIIGEKGVLSSVEEDDKSFLNILNRLEITLGSQIEIKEIVEFDQSFQILIDNCNTQLISNKIANNLFVTKL